MDNGQNQAEVKICVAVRRKRDKRGRKTQSRRVMVFAFWGWRPASPRWAAQEYRKRFGIESSYRQMNQCRIRTCSRNAALRLLLVGIALALRNAWVWFHHTFFNRPSGRGIRLHLERLRLRTMLLMLQRSAEARLECVEVAQVPLDSPLKAEPDG
jgi:putative transposase